MTQYWLIDSLIWLLPSHKVIASPCSTRSYSVLLPQAVHPSQKVDKIRLALETGRITVIECRPMLLLIKHSKSKVNLNSCEARLNTITFSKALRYGYTQFYLQTSHTCVYSPPQSITFGWYSFYCSTEDRRLSRPRWLVTYRNKVSTQE